MDQTCLGNGGFAPMIFPSFRWTRFAAAATMPETSVMMTSSASEAAILNVVGF